MIRRATTADLPRLCRTGDAGVRRRSRDALALSRRRGVRGRRRRGVPVADAAMAGSGTKPGSPTTWSRSPHGFRPDDPRSVVPEPAPTDHPEQRLGPLRRHRARSMAANTPAEPHWYLNLLATHPDWQRQGLGAALIDQVERVRPRRPAALPRDRDDRQRRLLHATSASSCAASGTCPSTARTCGACSAVSD